MIWGDKMTYATEPLSRMQIRKYTYFIRSILKCNTVLMFPVVRFLEILPSFIGDKDFCYIVVSDSDLPFNIHAEFDLEENCIRIKESVYEGACNGVGRDRMTIVHEIGHVLLLKYNGLKLYRSFDHDIPIYCDPEWQAKCFAGELLIPAHLIQDLTIEEISKECGVSPQAAAYQLSTISRKR